jgi:hypothetical protein
MGWRHGGKGYWDRMKRGPWSNDQDASKTSNAGGVDAADEKKGDKKDDKKDSKDDKEDKKDEKDGDKDDKEEKDGDKKEEKDGDKKEEKDGDKKEEKDGDKKEEKDGDKKEEKDGDKKEEKDGDKKEEKDGDKKESTGIPELDNAAVATNVDTGKEAEKKMKEHEQTEKNALESLKKKETKMTTKAEEKGHDIWDEIVNTVSNDKEFIA